MLRFLGLATTFCVVSAPMALAAGPNIPTVKPVDSNMTIGEALKGRSDCHIINEGGKTYTVCPYKVTPDTRAAISRQQN